MSRHDEKSKQPNDPRDSASVSTRRIPADAAENTVALEPAFGIVQLIKIN